MQLFPATAAITATITPTPTYTDGAKDNTAAAQVAAHVKTYRACGLHPLRLAPGGKGALDNNWPSLEHPVPFQHHPGENVGLLTGVRTPGGFFSVIDVDVRRTSAVGQFVTDYVLTLFTTVLGSTVQVRTGGSHQGHHLYYLLDKSIDQKLKLAFDLGEPSAIEILCRGRDGMVGFNAVAVPSIVENRYHYANCSVETFPTTLAVASTEKLLDLLYGQLILALRVAELGTLLGELHRRGEIDGYSIDTCLAEYLISHGVDDLRLQHLAYQTTFGERYDAKTTSAVLGRTADRIDDGKPVQRMGSILATLEPEPQSKLQEILKRLEKATGHRSTEPQVQPLQISAASSVNASADSHLENEMFTIDRGGGEPVQWLIDGILPRAKFILLHAPPGTGKTHAAILLAAIIAKSGLATLYFNHEQKNGDVGEKLRSVGTPENTVSVVNQRLGFSLFDPAHRELMGNFAERYAQQTGNLGLIVVDSLMAITSGDLNGGAVGGSLLFFNELAERTGATVLVVHHNNRHGDTAQRRMFGSSLIAGAIVLSYELEPYEQIAAARKLVVSKSNISALPLNREFVIGQLRDRPPTVFPLDVNPTVENGTTLADRCRDLILDLLHDGEEIDGDSVREQLRKKIGNDLSDATLTRATQQLGVVKARRGDSSFWQLPKTSIFYRLYHAAA